MVIEEHVVLSYIAGDAVKLVCNLVTGGPPPGSVMWL